MYVCMYGGSCARIERSGESRSSQIKRKATKGEIVAGRATKGELRSQGSRASGRLRETSGQSVPEATKKSVDLEEVAIEVLTERRRMTVEERKELPVSCAQCGRHFSQSRYMQRHKCVTTRKRAELKNSTTTRTREHGRGQPARTRRHQQGHRGRHAQD